MDLLHIAIVATEAATQAAPLAAEAATEAAHAAEDPGILGTLGVDWRLFLAQLVNFGIVLLIFWKWVVKPLGQTLTDRQAKIESGLKNATYMEDEKRKFEEWKTAQMQEVRGQADQVLKTATAASEKLRQETVQSAQSQASQMIEQAKSAIEAEKTQALKEARTEIADLVVLASEKILHRKLDAKSDRELVDAAVKEIK